MPDKKLSQLPTGEAFAPTDLLYSAQDLGGGTFGDVKQPIQALTDYMFFVSGFVRKKLTSDLNLYISPAGSDTINTGHTVGSPWQTIQRAFDYITNNLDTAGFQVFIHMAAGTYAGARLRAHIASGEGITLLNDGGTVTITSIIYVSAAQFNFGGTNTFTFIANSAAALCIAVDIGGIVNCYAPMSFASSAFTDTIHFYAQNNGTIQILGNVTITGNFLTHMNANVGGFIQMTARTTTFVAGPTAGNSFIVSSYLGYIVVANGQTFTGPLTGRKALVIQNSILITFGQGMPGSIPEVITTGGQFS